MILLVGINRCLWVSFVPLSKSYYFNSTKTRISKEFLSDNRAAAQDIWLFKS